MSGHLALVGGGEFAEGCTFDAGLLEASGGDRVLVVPTGAAYEHPGRLVEAAVSWFDRLGATAVGLDLLARPDAADPAIVDALATSRFTYLVGGSPLHLRSVLKDSPAWEALVSAWRDGGVLAGSSAGAMVLCDPMVDPRGGAFTLGLGLVPNLALVTEAETWSPERLHRTRKLANTAFAVLHTGDALVHRAAGWETIGAVEVHGELP